MLVAVVLLPLLFYFFADQAFINRLVQEYRPKTGSDYFLWFSFLALAMSVGLPRQVAAFSSGYLLGAVYGTLFATLAASLACLLTFVVARFVFHQSLTKRYPRQLETLSAFFKHDVFTKAFIIRLIPAGSNFLTNVLAGTAKAPLTPYLAGTMLGFIPQMTLFSMLGAGVSVGDNQQVMLSATLVIIAGILVTYLVRKSKNKSSTVTKSTID